MRVGLLAFATALVLAGSACGPAPSIAPATVSPATPRPSASVVAVATPSGSPESAAASAQSSSRAVVRDDSLLAVLPPDIDGNPVTIEEASFAEAATDPAFAGNIAAAAFAIV